MYTHVLTPDFKAPNSQLYALAALKPGADVARTVIANLNNLANLTQLGLNPQLVSPIVEVMEQLQKIAGGLDYWGVYHATVPIWTFDYLQSVAVHFAQLAVNAERDYINFQDPSDKGSLTRQQLSEGVSQVQAAQLDQNAAQAEATVYQDALAQQRAQDANQNANDYANDSSLQIQYQEQRRLRLAGETTAISASCIRSRIS